MSSQLASFAHIVFVRHVTCAEHGELVEVGHQGGTAIARNDRGTTVSQAANEGAGHGHEHCLMAPHRRDRVLETSTVLVSAVVPQPDSFKTIVSAAPRAPPIDVILIAPKNSPPV